MHGVTRTIPLHVTFLGSSRNGSGEDTTRWRVTTDPLQRRDYHLLWNPTTESVSMISQEVTINMEIEAVAAP